VPIRLRLALWYGLLLGVTLVVFCVGLYLALQAALERNFDQMLRVRAAQVERELSDVVGDQELTPGEILASDLEPGVLEEFAEPGVYVQVLSPRGDVLVTSGTLLPVNYALIAQIGAVSEAFDTLAVGDQQLRSLYWPVRAQHRVTAVVQVAETMQIIQETTLDARNLMASGGLVLLIAALGSGWLLTGRALRPVSSVTAAARHIAETGTFGHRLPPSKPHDELSALAAAFDVMVARVEQIVSQQRQFLADTSHELRNPLSVIRGNLDFVRRVTTDQACLESLHEAEVEAARMSRLVNDLLLLAQSDRAEFLAPRPLRLDLLLRQLAEQAQAATDDLVLTVDAPTETWVLADPDRLRQLLWNLLENAMRYTPTGGCIALALRADATVASLEVADTGPGVPPEHEARVFERFYRADASRARATGGAGLGLAIVKHIAEAHGGRVVLRNRPGEGASFLITLPTMTDSEKQVVTSGLVAS
jgi:signal transduction histidine kinase